MGLALRVALGKGEAILLKRLEDLQPRLASEPAVWPEYCELLRTLAAIGPATAPETTGRLLSTQEMAERLGLAAKTLLKHAAAKRIRPAVRNGKHIRWSGRESLGNQDR